PKHRCTSRSEPCPGDRGSRKAKHGCFARESGQDALTERKATPGRQGAASIRGPRRTPIVSTSPSLSQRKRLDVESSRLLPRRSVVRQAQAATACERSNWASSVEPVSAVTLELPPWITVVTSSK